MKCRMPVNRLRTNAAYYSAKDFDEKLGGDFTVFVVPFPGNDDERFYYTRRLENGKFEIEGEGYIVTNDDSLKRHKKEAREDLGDAHVVYRWLDEEGRPTGEITTR